MRTSPMLAVTYDRYGPPSSLRLDKLDRPTISDEEVLVRVPASSVNPSDWHRVTGTPGTVRIEDVLRPPPARHSTSPRFPSRYSPSRCSPSPLMKSATSAKRSAKPFSRRPAPPMQ